MIQFNILPKWDGRDYIRELAISFFINLDEMQNFITNLLEFIKALISKEKLLVTLR